ncbi:MAG: MFS transporter [Chloroflexota bacterium]
MNQTVNSTVLLPWQRTVVGIAWMTYAAYYLGRVNLAVAIPDMTVDLALSKSQIGLISTVFIFSYSLGTLLNVWLGDRLNLRRFVAVGLIGSGVLTILFGSLSAWRVLLFVWIIGGYFQAMGWGPILRTLANWLTPAQRQKVSGFFGSSFAAGSAITWLLTGWLVVNFGWRMAFWIPGILMIIAGLIWYTTIRDTPQEAGYALDRTTPSEILPISIVDFILAFLQSFRRLWTLTIAAIFAGFIFAAFTVWIPTYYVEVGGLNIGLASTLSALLPFVGIGGTLLISWLITRYFEGEEAMGLIIILIILTILFLAYPAIPFDLVISSGALMLVGSVTFGATSLLLATMTMTFGQLEETSSIAGLLDFSFSLGGAFTGIIIGAILDFQSWNMVFFVLAGAAFVSACFIYLTRLRFSG